MPASIAATDTTSCDSRKPHVDNGKILTLSTLNPNIKDFPKPMAFNMWMFARVKEIEKQLAQGTSSKPFKRVLRADMGDCQACGQKPVTFVRQVIALCTCDYLFDNPFIPDDAKQRARRMLAGCAGQSLGSYTATAGVTVIREDVASYIAKRDGHDCNVDDVFLSAGATTSIRAVLKLLSTGKDDILAGILVPVPQFSIYWATIREVNSYAIPYYLNEEEGWSLDINELQRALDAARGHCLPRAIVVINPGNPTGNVLSRQNIEDVIKFAYKEKLFILADEVYQQNVYTGSVFLSFKKVMTEMGDDYVNMELASFMSASKGIAAECGLRGGYCELINVNPDVRYQFTKMLSTNTCPVVTGQVVMGVVTNPPKEDEPSYERFEQEKAEILDSLEQNAKLVTEMLNKIDGIECSEISGSMYAFPRIFLPQKAIDEAKINGREPDQMYCLHLLEEAGVSVMAGSCFGQREGTYHFRMTILLPIDEMKELLDRLKEFHAKFTAKHS